jgi:hypothetical protein
MILTNKSLLIMKPQEPFHLWLRTVIEASQKVIARDSHLKAIEIPPVSLEMMQMDATCYVMPKLPPIETAKYIQEHAPAMFTHELNNWCKVESTWPPFEYQQFLSYFNFDFYFDWLDFNEGALEDQRELQHILLLIKPRHKVQAYLRQILIEKMNVSPEDAEKKVNMQIIERASTAVITNIQSLQDVERFLLEHYREIFEHELLLWVGPEFREAWPDEKDLALFKEWFSVEIHQHTFLLE